MARLTAQEREQLAELGRRAQEEDQEDAGLELWVKDEKGRQVQLTGTRARKFLAQLGLDDDEQDPTDPGEGDADADPADPPPAAGSFWGRSGKKG